jgi:hypothetical protein
MTGNEIYLISQMMVEEYVRQLQPDAPVRREAEQVRRGERAIALRAWLSLTLRRLADAVEPAREALEPVPAGVPRSSGC